MEWDFIISSHQSSQCSNIETVIGLFKTHGYSALNANPLGVLNETCLYEPYGNIRDVVWVHEDANPLWDKMVNYIECVYVKE